MISNAILLMLSAVVNALLLPLQVINIVVDFSTANQIVYGFLSVIYYLLPWDLLSPIFILIFAIFSFRIVVAVIMAIWRLLPFA